jgi:toxin ParE1/3/4
MVEIKWLNSAKKDLREIYDFIAFDSKFYASYQIKEIKSKVDLLRSFPLAGKKVEEIDDESIREIIQSHYRIIYRILEPELIHIIMVHHGARDLFDRVISDKK